MPTVLVVEIDDLCNEITDSAKSFQVDTGAVIFDALDDLGLKLAHGCLSGSCGACRIIILEGHDNIAPMSYIENETVSNLIKDYDQRKGSEFLKDKYVRLSCRAKINGNIKIAVLKA